MPIENLFHIFTLGLSLIKQFPSRILAIIMSQDRNISKQDLAFKNILLQTCTHQTKSTGHDWLQQGGDIELSHNRNATEKAT